ncbi:hypothetical protein CONCODRAFT_13014, partial [Conidiobolus coronatus NRRL 28638]
MSDSIELSDINGQYTASLRIVFFVYSICGLTFTSTLLLILIKKLRKKKHNDIVLTLIAVSVDCVASIGILFRAIFSQYPYNLLKAHYNWCAYDAAMNSLVLVFSGHCLSVLSLQRMLLIVFNFRVSIYIWLLLISVLGFPLWTLAIMQALNNNMSVSMIEVLCIGNNNNLGIPYYYDLLT